jgi:hypothetical protein
MTDAYVLLTSYSVFINSHILSSFLPSSLSIDQQQHSHSSPYCPFFVTLITTDSNQLNGTIPEIGQMTGLAHLYLGKYDGCSRSSHVLFCIYKLKYCVLFSPQSISTHQHHHCHSSQYYPFCVILITTANNQLSGTIPEIEQLTGLAYLYLRKDEGCLRAFF